MEADIAGPSKSHLAAVIEHRHGLAPTCGGEVHVLLERSGQRPVERVVHVFDLTGHPKANRAYAWSSPIEGSDKRRFFTVLHVPPITSPVKAVRAAIVAENRGIDK